MSAEAELRAALHETVDALGPVELAALAVHAERLVSGTEPDAAGEMVLAMAEYMRLPEAPAT